MILVKILNESLLRPLHFFNQYCLDGHVENMELANESLSASRDQLGSTEDENGI